MKNYIVIVLIFAAMLYGATVYHGGSYIGSHVVGTGGAFSVSGSGTIAATTAAALASNPTNCSAGNYPLGIDANGNVESCTAAGGGSGGGHSFHFGQGAAAITASATHWGMGSGFGSNASQVLRYSAFPPLDTGETCTLGNLRVQTAGSSTATLNLAAGTLQVDGAINGTASAVTCTVGIGSSSCSDLTNTATVSAGDYVSFKMTAGAYSTAPYVQISMDCRR